MKKILLLIFIFPAISQLYSQEVFYAESYSEQGKPYGVKNVWEIQPWGSPVYIIYDNGGVNIKDEILYLFIDKSVDGEYQPYDSKAIAVENSNSWLAVDYKFTQPGEYEAYFINISQEKLASAKVTIKYAKEQTKHESVNTSVYYDNCKLVFCDRVLVGGIPFEIRHSTSTSRNGGKLIVHIDNKAPLKTEMLFVDIWKKENNPFEYDGFVESKKYKIDPEWSDAFFRYQFKNAGEYKFTIYNDKEVQIKTGFITVYN